MKKILKVLVGVSFVGIMIGIIVNASVYAVESSQSETIKQKWIMTLYNQCFSDGLENKTISVTAKDANSGAVADSVFDSGVGEDRMYLPSAGFFSGKDGETISCQEVYKYALGYMGVGWENVVWGSTDLTTIADMLALSGYTLQGNGGKISLDATVTPLEASNVGSAASVLSANVAGTIQYYIPSSRTAPYAATLTLNGDGSNWKIGSRDNFARSFATVKNNVLSIDARQGNGGTIEETQYSVQLSNNTRSSYDSLVSLIGENIFVTPDHCSKVNANIAAYCWVVFNNVSVLDGGEFVYDSSNREKGEYMLSDDERYDLYHYYFNVVVPNEKESASCSGEKDDSMQDVNLKVNGKWVKYYFKKSNLPLERTFKDIYGGSIRDITLGDIIAWFNSFPAEEKCDEENTPDNPINPVGPIDGSTTDSEVDCFNAAGALGWILCPVIDFAQHTITAIYDSIVSNFLEFRASFLEIRDDNAVYTAWQTFQSFANIAFVIVLLIVIFSQLTGVGIDNLGIKRVLPKLIIAAILINLSYLICMLLVDLSNILGVGFNNIFSEIIVHVDSQTVSGSTGAAVISTVMTLVVSGAVGGLAVTTAGIWGPVVVLPLLLGLITTLIGILFFFIILGARQAAIIILVVVSPVAFACYMLPNTKPIFDRWFKMFEGLLLVFPICGLLMGGSAFASDILLTLDTGFLGKLIAMLVGVIPFFFIPSLLRSSLSAMGNLGARISGFGQNMGRGLTGAIRNSDTYKTMSQSMFERSNRAAAGLDRNHQLTARGRRMARRNSSLLGRTLGLDRLQARRMAADDKFREADISSQARLQGAVVESEMAEHPDQDIEQVYRNRFVAARDNGNGDDMFSVIEQMKKAGIKASHIAKITREELGDKANYGNMSEGQRANFLREFGNKYAGDFLKKDFEQMMWATSGGYGYNSIDDRNDSSVNPILKNLSGYAAGNIAIDDMKDNDVASLSADRMTELINGGKISQEQAQRVWAANNSMDDVERLILGAYARNNTKISKQQATQALTGGGSYAQDSRTLSSSGTVLPGGSIDTRALLRRSAQDVNIRQDEAEGQVFPVRVSVETDTNSNSNPAPSRGNMTDEQLQNLRGFYQRKVNNNTATPEDRRTLNRINNELDLRETGYSRDEGTPV